MSTHNDSYPPFTCLMSVYQKENPAYLKECLTSICNSSIKPQTLVLVCDGPLLPEHEKIIEDNSKTLSLETVRLKENQGLARALNQGLAHCRTEWIARMDSDDICLPDRFEKQLSFIMAHPDVDLFGGHIEEFDETSNQTTGIRRVPIDQKQLIRHAKRRNPFNHMTVMYRKSVIDACGGYPVLYLKEDYGLWIKVLHQGAVLANCDATLVRARAGKAMIKRRGGMNYVRSEVQLQRFMVQHQIKPLYQAIIDGMLRSLVFISPSWIRLQIYQRLLRH